MSKDTVIAASNPEEGTRDCDNLYGASLARV